MKMIIAVLILNFTAGIASAQNFEFCGQGGETLFNSQRVTECLTTRNTCETEELKAAGWMPSANGNCGPTRSFVCGPGGSMMTHPQDPSLRVQSLSTCDTRALRVMGWIVAE